ncbi:NAD(P)/FAD-dependent oxidoreductase [Pararhizobium sp.]|uniref:NAD(P)/FAD-dependent oxidoreductase n=1 Tax=Pararhizobium sp. TaxID=1977563 RepID=UPI002722A3FF|nr:FAD-binding oxidoreductase [Pararhizobium sp.]MDO9414574.1 FAD-binding oxidoreductase [Pararhizobium sp.]
MDKSFDFIVVGKGMMGAAAARHLTLKTSNIALIGPDEPNNRADHEGVFSSHYDSGRVTRTIDGNADWALLANRSIARYRAIEDQSGIGFYSETGCLMAGPLPGGPHDYLSPIMAVRDRLGVDAPLHSHVEMTDKFPWFHFPAGSAGVFEAKGAGHIDPRKLVRAQVACVTRAGGTVVASEVAKVTALADHAEVITKDGETYSAGKVLIAAGGFSVSQNLLPEPLDLVVLARTIVLAEISEKDAARYSGMPSLIDETGTLADHFYMVPPVRYPDGKLYIKIGGDPTDIELHGETAIRAWFRGEANAVAATHLERMLRRVIPEIEPVSVSSMPCVTTYTKHGYPYAGYTGNENVAVLTGGNGAAAKSSDEIGRLGAKVLLDGRLDEPAYTTDFAVHFR